jgi:hypothetical protein
VRIEIGADDVQELRKSLTLGLDANGRLPGQAGISCTVVPQPARHAFPAKEVLVLVVEFATAVSAQLIANWLYDRLRGRHVNLIVGEKKADVDNRERLGAIIGEQAQNEDKEEKT